MEKTIILDGAKKILEKYSALNILHRSGPGELLPVQIGYVRLYYGSISVWGGFPGSGKTSLVLSILTAMKQPFIFFSLELQDIEIVKRIIASRINVPFIDILPLDNENITKLIREKDESLLSDMEQKYLVANTMNFEEILHLIRIALAEGIRLFAIDYVQLMTSSDGTTGAEDPSFLYSAMTSLLSIAITSNAHIFIVSQLRKEDVNRRNANLNAFFGSGSLTQLSSVACLLRRDELTSDIVYVQVLKNRYGSVTYQDLSNIIPIKFYPEYLKFSFSIEEEPIDFSYDSIEDDSIGDII